jgi:hypothetical protein
MITPLYEKPASFFYWQFEGTPESIDEFNAALTSNGTTPAWGLATYVSPTAWTWLNNERTYGLNETIGIKLYWDGATPIDVFQPNELPRLFAQFSTTPQES